MFGPNVAFLTQMILQSNISVRAIIMYTAAKSKTKIYKLQHGKYGVKIEQV
jgi:hypothetical protein